MQFGETPSRDGMEFGWTGKIKYKICIYMFLNFYKIIHDY